MTVAPIDRVEGASDRSQPGPPIQGRWNEIGGAVRPFLHSIHSSQTEPGVARLERRRAAVGRSLFAFGEMRFFS
jgi:hypothetical protein